MKLGMILLIVIFSCALYMGCEESVVEETAYKDAKSQPSIELITPTGTIIIDSIDVDFTHGIITCYTLATTIEIQVSSNDTLYRAKGDCE